MGIRSATLLRANWVIKKIATAYISWADRHSLMVHVHPGDDNTHFPRPFKS